MKLKTRIITFRDRLKLSLLLEELGDLRVDLQLCTSGSISWVNIYMRIAEATSDINRIRHRLARHGVDEPMRQAEAWCAVAAVFGVLAAGLAGVMVL